MPFPCYCNSNSQWVNSQFYTVTNIPILEAKTSSLSSRDKLMIKNQVHLCKYNGREGLEII